MMLRSKIAFCMVALLLLVCVTHGQTVLPDTYEPTGTTTLAVIGVSNRVKDDRWKDLRVGFGLKGMLIESLSDSGRFRLMEEKPEIRERLGLTVENVWPKGVVYSQERLAEIAESLEADLLVYATVKSFNNPSSNTSIGFVSRKTTTAKLRVEVCLYERHTQELICKTGKGGAKFVADGILVQYQDDGQLSTQSLIGKASKQAIDDAVARLIPECQE